MGSGLLWMRRAQLVIAPTTGELGFDVSELRFTFKIRKTSSSSANASEVGIYNLARETRNKIVRKKMAVVLRAGYGESPSDALPLLASGVVLRAEHSPQPPDVISTVQFRDGGLGLDDARAHRSYPAGMRVRDVVADLLGTMPDVSVGSLTASALDLRLSSRRVFSGTSRNAIDKLATAFGFEWSVQNGSAQALDRTGATGPQTSATLLSPESGMVGSPTLTDAGVKIKSLLMPHLIPGGFIQLQSDFVSGYFRIVVVEHEGDTFEGDYCSTVEAKSIDKWVGPGAKVKKKGK